MAADPSEPRLSHAARPFDLGRLLEELRPLDPEELRVRVRRPDDLLVFDLLFDNLRIAEAGAGGEPRPARLVRRKPSAPATLIVELPPQSFGEEAFLQAASALESGVDADEIVQEVLDEDDEHFDDYPKKNAATTTGEDLGETLPASRVRMAGPSRLAFTMPAGEDGLDFTLAAVLEAMRTWPLRLDVSAKPDPPPRRGRAQKVVSIADSLGNVHLAERWAGTRHDLVSGLEARGAGATKAAGDLGEAVVRAGARVADRALAGLTGLAGTAADCLAPVLQDALFAEADRLAAARRGLRRGAERDALLAALALASTETLVARAPGLRVSVEVIGVLPFLPLLISPHLPPRTVTALELPYRLLLSPIESARFTHRDLPFARHGRTELWHTRMTTGADDLGRDAPGKARAIWSPDYPIDLDVILDLLDGPKPFRMSLDPLDRRMLVQLMAGYDEVDPWQKRYRPTASRVERLHLSALGGLLDLEGSWEERPDGVDLEQWRHRASLGRDAYVRVVYAGYLCPCGHAASLVKVTERKFERLGAGPGRVAALRQRFFVVPRERVKVYDPSEHEYRGRNFPFTRVELLTRVTPDLLEPGVGASELQAAGDPIYGTFDGKLIAKRMVFWPMLPHPTEAGDGIDFRFDLAATDIAGRRVTFSTPLLFVGEIANDVRDEAIRAAYNASAAAQRRGDLGGATVTYAPLDPSAEGDPRLPTGPLTLAAGDLREGLHHEREPNFYPEVDRAMVGIRPLQKLLGKADAVVPVTYPQVYKEHGFGESDPTKNRGELFLQLVDSPFALEFGGDAGKAKSDALGSLASPQMAIQGLSRIMGPVAAQPPADPGDPSQIEAALANVSGGTFDPADFFSGAKILGGIELADLLTVVSSLVGADVPKMVSRELPDRVEAKFTWDTEITESDPLGLFIPQADGGTTRLVMEGVTTTPLGAPQDATFRADAEIDNFKVNLFGFVIVWFERLAFRAEKGQKPDVAVELRQGSDSVQFGGPLEFVNTLREVIPSGGFSDPPAIEVTPSGIGASYFLNLPTVSVGILSISNMSLGAGFRLPFDATPATVTFGFSRRESPFSLTVSFLGGGGFFALGISTRGVNEIEAALEFGAGAAIDLGVASGSVEIKAGVYFHWLEPVPDQGSTELSGYVRLHGELSILGIISASLTFNLQLSYLKEGGKSVVWGEATLTIEIEVLFFSASVEVRCRREFGGSESDPKFIDQIPSQAVWAEYCEAFALEEAA